MLCTVPGPEQMSSKGSLLVLLFLHWPSIPRAGGQGGDSTKSWRGERTIEKVLNGSLFDRPALRARARSRGKSRFHPSSISSWLESRFSYLYIG